MKKFKEFLNEEMMPFAQTEKGFVGVDNGPVRDNINIHLAAVTSRCCSTPYHAMEMIRKVLAPFSIFPPQTNFLDGDSGHEVFQIKQFGDKMGMTNDGSVVVKNFDPYYVYFEYQMNDMGSFDIFCEIVTEDELEEIMSDIEDEMEEGKTSDGDETDAEDSFDEYKAGNDLKEDYDFRAKQDAEDNAAIGKRARKSSEKTFWKKAQKKNSKKAVTGMDEENLNELHGKTKEAMKVIKKRIEKKHDQEWEATHEKREREKLKGSEGTKKEDKSRNDLAKRWLRADRAEKKLKESSDIPPWRMKGEKPSGESKTPDAESKSKIKKITKHLAKMGMAKKK